MAGKRKREEVDEEALKKICLQLDNKFFKVEDALKTVMSAFKTDLCPDKFPPIAWKHQCYPLFKNRTYVDIDLNKFCKEGKIRFFKLGTTISDHETAIVYLADYKNYLMSIQNDTLINKFIKLVENNSSMTYTSNQLKEDYEFSEDNIKKLVQIGTLAIHRTVGNWLLSIPNCGIFYKTFVAGRRALINMIRRTKFNEMSRTELLLKKPLKDVKFPTFYHILDLLGADYVQSVDTPSGPLFRVLN